MATIRDIAQLANVSAGTVSRVLNNDPTMSVTADTRQRITQLAKELNYQTRQQKNAPLAAKSIALLMSHSIERENDDDYWRYIKQGIFEAAAMQNLSIDYTARLTDGIDPNVIRPFDAVIITGPVAEASIRQLKAINPNIVLVDSGTAYDDINQVSPNLSFMMNRILDELTSAGRKHIAFIGGFNELVDLHGQQEEIAEDIRTTTYVRWCQQHNNPPMLKLVSWDPQNGAQAANELLNQFPTIDAIVVASDPLAVGVMNVLNEAQLAISVVSFDDLELVKYMIPALTTVHLPQIELGKAALKLASDLATGERDWITWEILPTTLIYRDTFKL
ncbi:MAG: LacI family DNA-binding transcriptional regulator [Lactobacillaceae bacterium]|jgi:LacI family transcriptional regulator|nr:LacI family DNA-binding transcriptional regulator [Lactobacillaceae bacterium]